MTEEQELNYLALKISTLRSFHTYDGNNVDFTVLYVKGVWKVKVDVSTNTGYGRKVLISCNQSLLIAMRNMYSRLGGAPTS